MLHDLRWRVRALFRRSEMEQELDEELRYHLARETDKLVAAGMSRAEAARRARLAFGGLERIKDDTRDARGLSWLDTLGQDLRYALRGVRRRPGFALAVVVTLGLGLGANVSMFGVVDRLLFRPPAYLRDPGRVHRVYLLERSSAGTEVADSHISYTRYRDLMRWTSTLSQTAAYQDRELAIGSGDATRTVLIATVSASYFDLFDARPVLGRFFAAPDDSIPSGSPVVVLSYAFWQGQFGGRTDVLGKPIQIGAMQYTVIGVAPPGFSGVESGQPVSAFIPITAFAATMSTQRHPSDYYTLYNWEWMETLVRRKPGVSVAAASADLSSAFRQSYAVEHAMRAGTPPPAVVRPRALAEPLLSNRGPNASSIARVAAWLGGVSLIVLLIACANVANLFVVRALRRQREIAVRRAMGVSRGRLFAQVLTETMLFATGGACAGILVAQVGSTLLPRLLPGGLHDVSVVGDARTLMFAGVAAAVVGALTSIAPALHIAGGDVAAALKGGVGASPLTGSRVRATLLVMQAALSVVLLVGAGLFVRSLQHVRAMRLGYDVDPVLYVEPVGRGVKLSDSERVAITRRLLDDARSIPGVTSAALGLTVPFWNTWTQDLFREARDTIRQQDAFTLQAGSPDYFRTVGTRIVRGRGITDADRAGAPPVMVVSDAMARNLWPDQNALGQCVRVGADTAPCATVVGIAEGVKQTSVSDTSAMQYYLPIDAFHPEQAAVFVRTSGTAAAYTTTVRRRLQRLMPGASYVSVTPMRDIVDSNTQSWQLGASMFVGFGILALVVAAMGLYSVIAYGVAQRTHELGIRLALGARSTDILGLVLLGGVRFAAAGIVLGGAIALLFGPAVKPLLFAERPTDPVVFGATTGVLVVTALAAGILPAWRASRVAPTTALRAD
jgi:predicted permease